MNRKKIIQLIAIIFLVTGVVLLYPNTNWEQSTSIYGFISVVFGTLGSVISIFIPSVFVFEFDKKTWSIDKEDYFINIPSKKHGMGKSPQMQSFENDQNRYQEVGLDQSCDNKGNITIRASDNFKGKIIIK